MSVSVSSVAITPATLSHLSLAFWLWPCRLCLPQDEEEWNKLGEARQMVHLESIFMFALVWSVGGTGATIEGVCWEWTPGGGMLC